MLVCNYRHVTMDSVLVPGNFEFIDTEQSLRPRRDDAEDESDPLIGPTDSADDPHYDPGIRFDPKDVVRIKATTAATNGTDEAAAVVRTRRPVSRTSTTINDGLSYDASTKTYTCEVCGKRSVWKFFMERHRRTHIGRRITHRATRDDAIRQRRKLRLRKKKPDADRRTIGPARRPRDRGTVRAKTTDGPKTPKRPTIESNETEKPARTEARNDKKLNGTARPETKTKTAEPDTAETLPATTHDRTEIESEPPVCTFCDKAFGSDTALRRHVEAHAAGKLFACDACEQTFARRSSLKRHLQTHMDDDDDVERPTVCQICDKVFRSRGHLKIHLTTHV